MTVVKYKEITSTIKPKLIISKNLSTCINALHGAVKRAEWSGILFYKIVEGSVEEPEKLVILADYVYPMDVGTSGWTEFNYSGWIDAYDVLPLMEDDVMVYKPGLIHSHHVMEAFFSGTDTNTLHEQAPDYNYFLSLIVNYSCNPVAKLAMFGKKTPSDVIFTGTNGEYKLKGAEEGVLLIYEFDIVLETEDWFTKRILDLKEEASKRVVKKEPVLVRDYQQGELFPSPKKTAAAKIAVTDEQLKTIIVQSLSGDLLDSRNIYQALKDAKEDFKLQGADWEDEVYQDISVNFDDVVCSVLGLEESTWDELDVISTKCHSLLKSYNWDEGFKGVVRGIQNGLTYFFDESYKV